MTKVKLVFIMCFVGFLSIKAQEEIKIHSHNDYHQRIPFWDAFTSGAKSIEADIILKDGELFVAHEEKSIALGQTLEPMYLLPLQRAKQLYGEEQLEFQLMLDVKTDAYKTLDAIVMLLDQYLRYLKPYNQTGVSIVISGNRPKEVDYDNYPEHIQFDCQNILTMPQDKWDKVAMISINFKKLSNWNGEGEPKNLEKVKEFIDSAKKFGKPIRFWGTPDTEGSWKTLIDLGIDFIGTDDPLAANSFIKTKNSP
ncbi:hypothetical protein [Flagellimonas nanhaiensis]|nr:hypothetical protein [Allomuricauda nanhaiensis]